MPPIGSAVQFAHFGFASLRLGDPQTLSFTLSPNHDLARLAPCSRAGVACLPTLTNPMAPKILLVDDDPLIHRLYQQPLERAGYELLSAHTGAQAVEIATRERPQVIVMDIMMPQMDGLSAMHELKADDRTKSIPVILMSANPHYHLSQMAPQLADSALFLTKPFGPASLISAVQRLAPCSSGAAGGNQAT